MYQPRVKIIDVGKDHAELEANINKAIVEASAGGWLFHRLEIWPKLAPLYCTIFVQYKGE